MNTWLTPVAQVNIPSTYSLANCERGPVEKCDVSSLTGRAGSFVVSTDLPTTAAGLHQWMLKQPKLVLTGSQWYHIPHGNPKDVVTFVREPVKLGSPVEGTFKERSPGSFKAFQAAKKAGKIVLKPMTAYDYVVQDAPIFNVTQQLTETLVRVGVNSPPWPDRCAGYNAYSGCLGYTIGRRNIDPGPARTHGTQTCDLKLQLARGEISSAFASIGKPQINELLDYIEGLLPPNNLRNEALDENYSGLWDLGTELAEAPETIKYLFGMLRRLTLIFLQVRSKESAARKRFKGKELMDELTSLWMQFRYAASPIAYSIVDGLTYLDSNAARVFISTRKREDREHSFTDSLGYEYQFDTEFRCFVKSASNASAWSAGLGLNPIKTLWEVTPLAFVVGWVLPIGQLLGALVPPSHLSQVAMMESTCVRKVNITHRGPSGPLTFDNNFRYYKAYTGAAIPNPPFPDVFLNWKRVVDASALSWSLFIRKRLK